MADFLVLHGSDRPRRRRLAREWGALVSWRRGLAAGSMEGSGWTVAWSCGRRAPVDSWTDGEGAALVLGDAIDGDRGRVDAHAFARSVSTGPGGPNGLDGYFVALHVDDFGVVVVSDVLGLYPVHWHGPATEGADPLLTVSSVPWTPDLPPGALDPHGLVGTLMMHGTAQGQTLLPGVRRVPAGHVLTYRSRDTRLVPVLELPETEAFRDTAPEAQDARLHEALSRAVQRHTDVADDPGILLTGGRDSRMLADLLVRQGVRPHARTVGRPRDHEALLARRVCERLGLDHELRPLPDSAFVEGLRAHVRMERLTSGAAHAFWWGAPEVFEELPARTVTGHLFDVVVGGALRYSGTRDFGMDLPWEEAFALERRSGLDDDLLATLKVDADGAHRAGLARSLEAEYLGHPVHQRLWRWMLSHYCRLHIGCVLRPISYSTWPIVPVLDRELVRLAASLDSRAVANRTGQDRMLLRFHPEIADIPHVMENGDPARALRASPWGVLSGRLRARLRRHASIPRPDDRRFVWRNTDFGNPGWRRARRAVEPMRPLVRRLFADGPFDAYWPPPDGRPRRVDFASQQGPKLLLGLALWLSREGAPEPP